VDNPLASGVFIEYRQDTSPVSDWVFWAEGDPSDTHFETTNAAPATDYEVSVRYRDDRTGILSTNRLILGPETTGGLIIDWGDQDPIDPGLLDDSYVLRGTTGGDIGASAAEAADAVERANLGLDSDGVVSTDKVETTSIVEESVTPAFSSYSAGAVSWTASSAEQDLQEVTTTVVRGRVVITAEADIGSITTASGWIGRFRLYRDATELTDAERKIKTIAIPGGGYDLPSQLALTFLDEPGAGTYDYRITFTPGASMTGDITNRSLICDVRQG
jgi:hypothetical protein